LIHPAHSEDIQILIRKEKNMHPEIWNWLWWFAFGVLVGAAGTVYFYSLKTKGTNLRWYEWLLAVLTVFLAGFAIQNFFASFAEKEPQAAWLSLVFIGVPTVILGVVFIRLVSRHTKQKGKAS
jgi:cation transport ATPase